MRIVDLGPDDEELINQVAAILVEAFKENWPEAWPDFGSALDEVRESFQPDRISRVALNEDGTASGWIGGISEYDGNVWELHPLAISPEHQGRGI
ncbi:MAG TPA: GNAT family N-acetyltransferase, partial [Chloroflexia bacterium]|nr:GNAT family N-acetyltransferase [Chloroflexia bacterium]